MAKTINLGKEQLIDAPMWFHTRGLMQTATGYGKKLRTAYKVGIGNRAYRVYCHCMSNIGSLYIIIQNERVWIDVN